MLSLLLAASALGSPARADVIQKPGFSLSLPDGWVEIPQEVLDAVHDALKQQAPKGEIPRYDYGFQLATAERWMAYPYVLVQVSNTGRIPEHQLKAMPKINLNPTIANKTADLRSILSNAELGQMQYDEAARVVWMGSQSDVVGVGRVQGMSGLIPTEKGLLQVHGYALESSFQEYLPTFRGMVESVVVSPDLAYEPRWSDDHPLLGGIDWAQVAGAAVGGGLVGLLFSWIRKRKKA